MTCIVMSVYLVYSIKLVKHSFPCVPAELATTAVDRSPVLFPRYLLSLAWPYRINRVDSIFDCCHSLW